MDVARLACALPANAAVRRATAALLAAGLAVYVVRALVHPFGPDLESLLETPLYDALLVAAALVCLARLPSLRRNRLPWGLVSLALLLWAAADVYSTTALDSMADAPYPSLADAGWLAIYPLCYVAVLLLASRRGGGVPAGVWLDGVITALAAAALTAALLFEPIVSAAVDGDAAAVIVNLAYPIGDLILITLVTAVLGLTGWRPGRMWLLFGAGLVASGVADCLYLERTATGSYVEGEVLDVMWPLATILMAWAAWQPQRPRRLQLEAPASSSSP